MEINTNLIVIEILELRDIVHTANVDPGSVFHDMVLYISLTKYDNQRTICPISLTRVHRIY